MMNTTSTLHSLPSIILEATTLTFAQSSDDDDCSPYKYTNTTKEACEYVKYFSDACESGGYFLWTQYIMCTEDDVARIFLIIFSVFCLFVLFLAMTITADDFFCCSISTIVDHLKISQSIAGITLMAFGNGAPDIFSTIASVLNTKKPKAGLAFGDLLGGGGFVTTIVLATVIITKPFKVAKMSILRDIGFYLVALGWMLFIMLYDSSLYVWQPAVYLVIYALYVAFVIFGRLYEKRQRKKQRYHRQMERAFSNYSRKSGEQQTETRTSTIVDFKALQPPIQSTDITEAYPQEEEKILTEQAKNRQNSINSYYQESPCSTKNTFSSPINVMMEPMETDPPRPSYALPSIIISPANPLDGAQTRFTYKKGKFHYSERDLGYESDDESIVVVSPPAHSGRRFTVMSLTDARSLRVSEPAPIINLKKEVTVRRVFYDFLDALNPIDDDFYDSPWYSKTLQLIKIPTIIILRLTVPLASIWCKTLTIIQCFTMPLSILVAFDVATINIIDGDPGLWIYGFIPSIILAVLVFFFTSYNIEPIYYKNACGYLGFIMSVSWINFISNEVVNVITMISVVSKLSHEILGLTVMAWSNSIGDLVADISVAKQGFSQMAASAAIGGPLFNLLFGFGTAFFIAKLQGKNVDISLDGVKAMLVLMVASSLIATLIILIINKFNAKRIHGIILIVLYIVLLIGVILADLKVVKI